MPLYSPASLFLIPTKHVSTLVACAILDVGMLLVNIFALPAWQTPFSSRSTQAPSCKATTPRIIFLVTTAPARILPLELKTSTVSPSFIPRIAASSSFIVIGSRLPTL